MNTDSAQAAANQSSTIDASLLLNRDELAELTGTRQAARQRRWLQDRGWPFSKHWVAMPNQGLGA